MRVKFSYLEEQFADLDSYFADLREFVKTGDFTLGKPLTEFEGKFAAVCKMPHAIGVGSGTDALILSLKALGIGYGDEVITSPNTFIATVGAIAMAGARPVFVDSNEGFTIDVSKIEAAITSKTKAIMPVHYSGNVADMPQIMEIATHHKLEVIEDACQSISASLDGKQVGSWGATACFSLHPLKNLNVWGDGGMITTRSDDIEKKLRLLRNHGLVNRDEVEIFGHNSRFDTLQAVIGNRLISQMESITELKIKNAKQLDAGLKGLEDFVKVPARPKNIKHVFHLYMIRVTKRDELLAFLNKKGVEAKVHYPIPVHLQQAAKYLGYKAGDFPVAENDSKTLITLPAHQHIGSEEIEYTLECIKEFYGR